MVIFEHNKHQVDQCRQLSKTLGFKSFLARNSDRVNTIARDRNGEPEYEIKSASEKIVMVNSQHIQFSGITYAGMIQECSQEVKRNVFDIISPSVFKRRKGVLIVIKRYDNILPRPKIPI